MRIVINKTKTIITAAMVVFFGCYGIFFIVNGPTIGAAVFLVIAALFSGLFFRYASTLSVNADGVQLRFLGMKRKSLGWSEIQEVGLIGENVFNHGKKKKTGDKYIYFSLVKMDADERFQMIIKWPPNDKLYVEYSEKALEFIMTFWHGEFMTYNVEDIYPNSAEPKGSPERK